MQHAFDELERAGYDIASAYTAVKDPATTKFVYRDRLWHGADMFGTGVASFGHVNGVHVQNEDTLGGLHRGDRQRRTAARPRVSPDAGRTDAPRAGAAAEERAPRSRLLRDQVQTDIVTEFQDQWAGLRAEGYLSEATAAGMS